MTPIPPIAVPAGDGRVNATALDGVVRLLTAKVNEVIAALGVAMEARTRLRDGSVDARAFSAEMRGMLTDLAARIGEIRRGIKPDSAIPAVVNPTAIPAETPGLFRFSSQVATTHTTFRMDGDAQRIYRLRFRARFAASRTLFSASPCAIRGLANTLVGSDTVVAASGTNFAEDVAPMLLDTERVPLVFASGEIHRIVAVLAGPDRIVTDRPFVTSYANQPLSVNFAVGTYMRTTHAFQSMSAVIAAGGVPLAPGIVSFPPGEMAPLGGTDFVWVSTAQEDILLTAGLFNPLAGLVDQQLPEARDQTFDIFLPGNGSLTLHNESGGGEAAFLANSDYPADDDPRFPAAYRLLRGQFVQLDLVAIEPIVLPLDAILTESGFPVQGESPQASITPE
jgi:hypothetical protein